MLACLQEVFFLSFLFFKVMFLVQLCVITTSSYHSKGYPTLLGFLCDFCENIVIQWLIIRANHFIHPWWELAIVLNACDKIKLMNLKGLTMIFAGRGKPIYHLQKQGNVYIFQNK